MGRAEVVNWQCLDADRHLSAAVEIEDRYFDSQNPSASTNYMLALSHFSDVKRELGDQTAAMSLVAQASAIARKTHLADASDQRAGAYLGIGLMKQSKVQRDNADRVKLLDESRGKRGIALTAAGNPTAAATAFQCALSAGEPLLPSGDPFATKGFVDSDCKPRRGATGRPPFPWRVGWRSSRR